MGVFSATVKDARGRVVPLVREHALSAATRERRRRLMQSAKPVNPTLREGVLIGLCMLPVILVAAMVPVTVTSGLRLPMGAAILVGALTGLVVPTAMVYVVRRVQAGRLARAYVQAGLCASCGYDLRAVQAGGDGFRTCPECGAAWLVETAPA
jgi:hypothetical protein